MQTLHDMMKPGDSIKFTMMGTKCWFFDHATPAGDGLYRIGITSPRIRHKDYYIPFVKDEADLKEKFKIFEPIHIGFYSYKTREAKGTDYHYTFFGRKPAKLRSGTPCT